ncbi:MAG TPA: MBL fold metallo-hydrolase [Candidatus Thermoplasmatota archaeon]|nr:MBL fold metallo-hydrolase [Candidatus Thermoplasmatota archaeon]
MADPRRRHPENAPGPWFVDSTCIDCDLVRNLAPRLFAESLRDGLSYVARQPADPEEALLAARGALACPTGSVGGPLTRDVVERAYPWPIDGGSGVSRLGYASPDSFGAMSYLVERPQGNLMVDSPRWAAPVERALAARGGLSKILLTHRDDVADAGRYARRFAAEVWIHEDDADAAPGGVPLRTFRDEAEVQRGVLAIPTPGHTKGHSMYLVDDASLFTGDSLFGSRIRRDLGAWKSVAWWSWERQIESLARLAREHRFEWVLPAHGGAMRDTTEGMHARLLALVERMRAGTEPGGW